MGLRAHSVKKYEIEYGDHAGFNYDSDTLANIIEDFCDDFYSGEDYADTNVIWEVDKGQFADMVKAIEEMSETDFNSRMNDDWEYGTGEYSKEYVLNLFKNFLADTQENSDYVRIAWL